MINCEIRARRESNSNNNRTSEVATDSVTTPCPAGKYLLVIENVLLNWILFRRVLMIKQC